MNTLQNKIKKLTNISKIDINNQLLTRNEFREEVLFRDNNLCCICKKKAVDAHHIIERRLFNNGGYYLNNGASLCEECHIKSEKTEISCNQLRDACGIDEIIIPDHLYRDNEYDKWGNIILNNGQRVKGELFYDESVQKIINPLLNIFTDYIKYPRTYHLPFSASKTNDDRTIQDCSQFLNKEVIVLEKLDGENCSIYNNYVHARSLENESHPSRAWVKNFASKIGWEIPDGWRICGENVYAKHAIHYQNLKSYFYMFSIWNDKNFCLSWDDTVEYANMLNVELVPVIWRGVWNEDYIINIANHLDITTQEGFVVRLTDGFEYGAFKSSTAKYVRKSHVQENAHNWKMQPIIKNICNCQ